MIKTYTAKVLEDALNNAASDLNCQVSDLQYEVILEKKGLFSKKVEIKAYCLNTVINYVKQYIETVLNDMNLELVEVTMEYTNGRIRANVNTSNNPLLIGRSGIILRSFNMIVKAAVQNTFQ